MTEASSSQNVTSENLESFAAIHGLENRVITLTDQAATDNNNRFLNDLKSRVEKAKQEISLALHQLKRTARETFSFQSRQAAMQKVMSLMAAGVATVSSGDLTTANYRPTTNSSNKNELRVIPTEDPFLPTSRKKEGRTEKPVKKPANLDRLYLQPMDVLYQRFDIPNRTDDNPSNICAPMSADVWNNLDYDGKPDIRLAPSQFFKRNGKEYAKLLSQTHRADKGYARTNIKLAVASGNLKLKVGDFLYLFGNSPIPDKDIGHLIVVSEIDDESRAYAYSNEPNAQGGYSIEKVLLVDPEDPKSGMLYSWGNGGKFGVDGFYHYKAITGPNPHPGVDSQF